MNSADPFAPYLREIRRNLSTGATTEHTHRKALQDLIEAVGDGIQAVNEPKRIECGAPDYIVYRGMTPIGYVEAKDVRESLDRAEQTEQVQRYRESLHNLILTNYLEFRWYVGGERRETARPAGINKEGQIVRLLIGVEAAAGVFQKFFAQEPPTIDRPRELAQRMAALARLVRKLIEETFSREAERGMLHAQFKAFRDTLIPDLTPANFADMYAQTITYGLFAARVRAASGDTFTRENAAWNLPKTNPFLRKLFNEIAGPDLDERIAWLVDDLVRLLARADMAEILKDFGKKTKQEDPVVHFYETFLAAYDPGMRQRRGVYYTPEPVVSYIVRSLDSIVRTRFNRPLGLADPGVLILDPAAGTGTFLYFVIQQIHETLIAMGQAGAWSDYAARRLLPRVFGFELLMAPYAVAHLKLGIQLQETGYGFTGDQRLGIYLTNSLEEAVVQAESLGFAGFITDEANAAAEIKREKPIMVVLGNPPYSVSSANRGAHIEQLMERYKAAVRREKNIQPLSDDYIKFIRFAHDRIERTGHGVIGMITNNSYLSGLIHRGMREELLKAFDEIYILNLHGNSLMKETSPDGAPDENVFDIRQGVAIVLFIKKQDGEGRGRLHYADLWGARGGKYSSLNEKDINTTEWQVLDPQHPHFFFVPKNLDLLAEYKRGWSVPEIFPVSSTGIKTHRDHFVIDFDMESLRSRIAEFRGERLSDGEAREQFRLEDTRDWNLSEARDKLRKRADWEKFFTRCLYRPFDLRPIYYSLDLIELPRPNVMDHIHKVRGNKSLLTMRRIRTEIYSHFFITKLITCKDAVSIKDNCYVFPLYLYSNNGLARNPNFSTPFLNNLTKKLGMQFIMDGQGDLRITFGPEDILHYAYAVFHSPAYRQRYTEFLKIDFPRLPLTSNRELFRSLAEKGEKLAALHLMEAPEINRLITRMPAPGSGVVEKVRYLPPHRDESMREIPGRVFINKTQYFEGIDPEVWEFHVGGYQVLEKWLKDRKGCTLYFDELFHYQKIVVALKETIRLMGEIDAVIPSWPMG